MDKIIYFDYFFDKTTKNAFDSANLALVYQIVYKIHCYILCQ